MRTPYFTLKQLTYFVMAARLGKISTAAAELNISQSAITTAILDLEGILGADLLERHASGVRLTYRGQMFFTHAEHILEAVDDAQRAPFRGDAVVTGQLRVCATYVVCGYFLLPIISRFRQVFPNIELTISEMPRIDCEQALINGEMDLSIMLTSNVQMTDALESIRLLRSRRRLWVAADSPLLRQKEVSLADIQHLPYVFLHVDDGEKVTRSYWSDYGLEPNVKFRTSSMEAMREWIALGMGVTIVSDLVYRPWSLDGRKIERIAVTEAVPPMEIGVAWKRGTELSPSALTFRDFLTQTAANVSDPE